MELIPETYGVLVFQEQVTFVARELAGMSVEESENVRIAMGKKKIKLLNSLKPIFSEGAKKKVDAQTAEKISLGRAFFHDPRFSVDGSISCASCHQPDKAFTDGLSVAQGVNGKTALHLATEKENITVIKLPHNNFSQLSNDVNTKRYIEMLG